MNGSNKSEETMKVSLKFQKSRRDGEVVLLRVVRLYIDGKLVSHGCYGYELEDYFWVQVFVKKICAASGIELDIEDEAEDDEPV